MSEKTQGFVIPDHPKTAVWRNILPVALKIRLRSVLEDHIVCTPLYLTQTVRYYIFNYLLLAKVRIMQHPVKRTLLCFVFADAMYHHTTIFSQFFLNCPSPDILSCLFYVYFALS